MLLLLLVVLLLRFADVDDEALAAAGAPHRSLTVRVVVVSCASIIRFRASAATTAATLVGSLLLVISVMFSFLVPVLEPPSISFSQISTTRASPWERTSQPNRREYSPSFAICRSSAPSHNFLGGQQSFEAAEPRGTS